jgi:regulation of enolase protein 1 (concanavalin A-like superfamily)
LLFRDDFEAAALRPEWQWQDPAQVSRYSLSERAGHLTLRPSAGVALIADNNLNAPRMLREVRGDFALETKMEQHGDGNSGLLVWKDVFNYVRLDQCPCGLHGGDMDGDMHLEGCVVGAYGIFGRGHLRGQRSARGCYLRLERTGDCLAALCSTDGVRWLTCGHVDFPVQDPLRVGVWAGVVVHFDYVQVLGRG